MGEVIDFENYKKNKDKNKDKKTKKFNLTKGEIIDFESKKFLKDWETLFNNNEKFFISLDQVKKEEYLPHLESLSGKSRNELLKIIKEGLKENGHKPYLKAVAEKLVKEYAKEKIKDYSDIIDKIKKINFKKEVLEKEKERLKVKEYLDLWSDLENSLFFLKETDSSVLPLYKLRAMIEILEKERWI